MSDISIKEIGEKKLVKEITSLLTVDPRLISGFGSDSGVMDLNLQDELLLINTDRTGMNIAYKLGLADGRCVGDFAVSHSVSDIYASGGIPVALSIALLLPEDTTLEFTKEVMKGCQEAASKYGAFIASGDTKKNEKFAMVVTALGKCRRENVITRSGAKPGDKLVITGNLGTMTTAMLATKLKLDVNVKERQILNKALITQNPPHNFPREMFDNKVIHAGMDNSDGLISSLYSICEQSNVGIEILEENIPTQNITEKIANQLGVSKTQLCFGSGDWSHLYAVDREKINSFLKYAEISGTKLTVIGEFKEDKHVRMKNSDGLYNLKRIENDRFGIGGTSWFEYLSKKINYLED
jgi:thiamine-monophosphate kinase